MLKFGLLGGFLLVSFWHPAGAFRTGAALAQRGCERTRGKHDRICRESGTCSAGRRSLSACVSKVGWCASPQDSTSGPREALAATSSAVVATMAGSSTESVGKCGATALSLTRNQLLSSIAAAAAGFLLAPWQASAAADMDTTLAMEAVNSGPAAAQGEVGGGIEEVAAAKYVVQSDEVGVLFGDGPIGIKLGDNPLKASGVCRVYVTEVLTGSQAIRQANLRAGFGVAAVGGKPAERLEPKEVAELIRLSPRPMEIVFRDPELLGRRLQAEADRKAEAVKRSKRKAAADAASPETAAPDTAGSATTTAVDPRSGSVGNGGGSASSGELRVTQVGKKPAVCGTRTKAGDLIEFRYSARLASDLSVEFDSSDRRGTGLPYAIVLGNGDVIKGLDLSLFDMCVGERRKIEIPARLAYGRKGSKAFGVPPDDGTGSADVVFGVELVSINFSINASDARDNFYTDDPCDAAAVAAGNASGQCMK
ncbi:unnamed protein product [Ectocarpus sp. CCAP 1310/34]|nr:unnamed protein product [Ectocarpus sp. CCAP 1310/34]